MAFKAYPVEGLGDVKIYKRKGSRSLRLSIAANGDIRVTIPAWAPFQAGLAFAESKRAWILAQRPVRPRLQHGQAIGKAHRLIFENHFELPRPATRLKQTEIIVSLPADMDAADPRAQHAAQRASIRALRRQAESLLPGRLEQLARRHGFDYRSVTIKQLKGRWGSCDQRHNIVLNLFLMQLPWDCIDYVILHELTHTRVLRHGPPFWKAMAEVMPDVQAIRKRMRGYQPILGAH